MTNANELIKEFEEMGTMIKWLSDNMERLPLEYQLDFVSDVIRFSRELKPLYIRSLIAVEGCNGDSNNIVQFPCKDDWDEQCWDDDEEDDSWIFDAIGEDEEE